MNDRNVQFPQRFQLVKVEGTNDIYDIIPAPGNVYDEGTLINKYALLKDATAKLFGLTSSAMPDDVLQKLSNAAIISNTIPKYQEITINLDSAEVGSIVEIPENGNLVEFYVAAKNYESGLNGTGHTLLVRKTGLSNIAWNSSEINTYANSTIDTWLNGTYKNYFLSCIQANIASTKFYYTVGNGNNSVTTLEREFFLLSGTEYGGSSSESATFNSEGSTLPTASTLVNTSSNGWTRSPDLDPSNMAAIFINGARIFSRRNVTSSNLYYFPAFTVIGNPVYYLDSFGNIHNEQEYEVSIFDVKGKSYTVGAQISGGFYVGTGEYGSDHPNVLTFDFSPLVLIILSPYNVPRGVWPFVRNCTRGAIETDNNIGNAQITIQWHEKTVSWYADNLSTTNISPEDQQLNHSGVSYYYVAIG